MEQVDYSQVQLGSAPSQDLALQLVDQLLLLGVASIFLASSDPLYLELHFLLPWLILCLLLEAAPKVCAEVGLSLGLQGAAKQSKSFIWIQSLGSSRRQKVTFDFQIPLLRCLMESMLLQDGSGRKEMVKGT